MATRTPEPPGAGWVGVGTAAGRLGLAEAYVAAGARTGRFPVVAHDGAMWMREADLEHLVETRAGEHRLWATYAEIEKLAGCSNGTLDRAVRQGKIEVRPEPRTRATRSLERESAERWARRWRKQRGEMGRRRDRWEERAPGSPPDDVHVWLDTPTAALVVGVTQNWLRHLARNGRAPVTRNGRRLWWRRDLLEAFAGARSAAERQSRG